MGRVVGGESGGWEECSGLKCVGWERVVGRESVVGGESGGWGVWWVGRVW